MSRPTPVLVPLPDERASTGGRDGSRSTSSMRRSFFGFHAVILFGAVATACGGSEASGDNTDQDTGSTLPDGGTDETAPTNDSGPGDETTPPPDDTGTDDGVDHG